MAKDNSKKEKPSKGGSKITNSDVKEATSAAANASKNVPMDFPDAPPASKNIPQVEANNNAPAREPEVSVPADAPEVFPAEPIVEVAPVTEVVPEVVPVVSELPQGSNDEPVLSPIPTQEDLEEKVIENWWNSRNRPSEINHFELASSPAGINMSKFSAYEAIVGKFKFRRSHAGANWQITIEEKKK